MTGQADEHRIYHKALLQSLHKTFQSCFPHTVGSPSDLSCQDRRSWDLALHDTLGLAHFPRSSRVDHAIPPSVAGSVCYMQSLHQLV